MATRRYGEKLKGPLILKYDTRHDPLNGRTINLGFLGKFIVQWGDGDASTDSTHTYKEPGIYTVKVSGRVMGVVSIEKPCLIELVQWGNICYIDSYDNFFRRAPNLISLGMDRPHITKKTSMAYMFANNPKFNIPFNHWDTSLVINFAGMLAGCSRFRHRVTIDTSNAMQMTGFAMGTPLTDDKIPWNYH